MPDFQGCCGLQQPCFQKEGQNMHASQLWTIAPRPDPASVISGDGYRITVLTDRLLRLEYEPDGLFLDDATQAVLCRRFPVPEFSVEETETWLCVETRALKLFYNRQPFSGTGLYATLKGAFAVYGSTWHFGLHAQNLGGTARTLDEADGEVPLDNGLISVHGYAVLDDSHSMRMTRDGQLMPAVSHGTDLYLFAYGHQYSDCLRDFLRLSGGIPVVPRFALGNWWSRYYPYTEDSYRCLMQQFESEQIPLSVAVLDINWHVTRISPEYGTGWTGYTWDREKFPDPRRLLSWLHAHGLHVTLNDHPADGVRPCEDQHAAMAEAMGDDPALRRSYPFDAADAHWMQAFEQTVLTPLEKDGVDFWWIDWQQQGGTTDPGMDPLFTLNHTRYLHALNTGRPPLILSRYAGPGSHRYPLGFSGDSCITWASLAFQPYFTATAANIGFGWWSHDIGGHMHGSYDPELSLRWLQFGVFSPILRLHSSNNPFMEKEPWTYPIGIADIMRTFLRLRHRLIPWLYTSELACSERNRLLLRPVYHDMPDTREAYMASHDEYMLGDCLLVAPVISPQDRVSQLACTHAWIPEGTWYDFFTGWQYTGPCPLRLFRSLSSIPVLVRAGSILPMDACETPGNGAGLPEHILLRVFPSPQAEGVLTEDNGNLPQDTAYRRAVTRFSLTGNTSPVFCIQAPEGDTGLLPENRRFTVELNGVGPELPDESSCSYTSAYDPEHHRLTLDLQSQPGKEITLHWKQAFTRPVIDRKALILELLRHAEIAYDLKGRVLQATAYLDQSTRFVAELQACALPDALCGGILEILNII